MPPLQPPDLYLFSVVAHKLDMATCLQQLAATWALDLRTECVDIKRSAKHLSLPKVRDSYLDRIRAKEFDAILLSPPCASFSRATWANFRGPRPVRSYELPRGLEKLTPFLAMEQPEDLGALPTGPHEGLRPASMWQWPQLADLLEKGLRTVAFHQASFGVPYAKPTRLLLCTSSTKAYLATMTRATTKARYPLHRVSVRCSSVKLKGPSRLPVLNSGPWLCAGGFPLCCSRRACSPLKTPLERGAPLRATISYRTPSR